MQKLPLRLSILATLSYSSLFQSPLTVEECLARLIGHFPALTKDQLERELRHTPGVSSDGSYFFLDRDAHTPNLRNKRKFFSQLKKQELEKLKRMLSKIPFISSVYITGSLAVENIHSMSDDIDILIVTKPGYLWLSRLIVVLWSSLLGKYRTHDSRGEFGWCFNLWLDQQHLEMPKESRSVYTSYEIIQAKQLLGTEDELLQHNQWVSEFINYSSKPVKKKNYEALTKHDTEQHQNNGVFERMAYQLQSMYMSSHKTTERVSAGYAFFHPRDTKNQIVKKWKERLKEIGVGKQEIELLVKYFGP